MDGAALENLVVGLVDGLRRERVVIGLMDGAALESLVVGLVVDVAFTRVGLVDSLAVGFFAA